MDIDNLFLVSMGQKVAMSDQALMETLSKKDMAVVAQSPLSDRACASRALLFTNAILPLPKHHLSFNYDDEDVAGLSGFVAKSQGDCVVVKTLALYKNTSLISAVMSCFLSEKGVSATDIGMMDLCVTEIFNNVIEHAYLKESSEPIVLAFSCIGNEVSVVIFDKAQQTSQTILVDSNAPMEADNTRISGRGIGIVQTIMDNCSVYFKNNRNAFLMSKKFEVLDCA